ncbi:hypothetical protein IFR05_003479 [Cadophora sp. M221]|nr:hypothetical protein IFR05_003479 [Cadophora sp. M221]
MIFSRLPCDVHIYPDGTVTFSNKKLPTVKDPMTGGEASPDMAETGEGKFIQGGAGDSSNTEAESSSSARSGAQIPAHQQESDWEWDENAQKYRDGTQWVWQE